MERLTRKRARLDSVSSCSEPPPPSPMLHPRRATSDHLGSDQSGEASMEDIYSMMQLFSDGKDQARARTALRPCIMRNAREGVRFFFRAARSVSGTPNAQALFFCVR